MPGVSRRLEPSLRPRAQPLLLHQLRHAMSPHDASLSVELFMHPWTAIAPLARRMDRGHLDGEPLRVLGTRCDRPCTPRVEAGAGHSQHGARTPNREVRLLAQDERELHPCSFAKKAVAFFK